MSIEVYKRVILENQETIFKKKVIPRNYKIPQTDNITVLIGIRRCGKTYTLYENAKTFEKEDVLFLDFEDERLISLNSLDDYDVIIDAYKSLFPDKTPVLFFDEIQNLKNWHFYLKRLHVKGYKIFVTGSNANLISKDIATFLKGRSLETTIFPFSFNEFLQLKNEKFSKAEVYTKKAKLLNLYNEFLDFGGFPEVIKTSADNKRIVARNIYQLLFYKDLVSKYDKNDYLLKLIMSKITENIGKEFSITSLANKVNVVFKTSIPTVTEYFTILPEPFLTHNVYQYRTSFVARQSKRKTYMTDNSFIFLNRITDDKSRLFENLVFNFLNRKHGELFYYKTTTGKEVDFFIKKENKLIQVCYSLQNNDTKQREIKALVKAMDEQKIDKAFIYSHDETETIVVKGKTIEIVPFWKVCLEG